MGDPYTQSLVYKTDPSPWHQLLVLSQAMINDAFWNMWAIADSTSPIRTFNMALRGGGSMKGQLEAPKISINVTALNPQLWYLITWKSGTLTLYTSEDPNDPDQKTWDVSGWVLAFPVSIATKNLDPKDPTNKGYVTAMGNPSGVFSLAQLYIDAAQAINYDPSMSTLEKGWDQETPSVRANFANLVDGWHSLMVASGKTITGFALQTTQPATVNSDAPSFPPTSLNYYMYPWLDPSTSNPKPTNQLDQNSLCYLLMTSKVAAPSPPVLNYSGTWVDGSASHGGSIVINSSQFWDDWLCPLLKFLNAASEIECTQPVAVAHGDGSVEVAPRFTASYNPDHQDPNDSYFNFTRDSAGNFSWKGQQSTSTNSDTAGGSAWNKIEVDENAQASSAVVFTRGGQLIKVTGTNTFNFTCKQTGMTSGPFKTQATFSITLNWHLNLALGVVSDGGLQISRIADPPGVSAVTVVGTSSSEGLDWNTPWDTYEDGIRSSMEGYFTSALGNVENDLMYGLAHQHQMFLPGSGTFTMQGAEFNNRGDLLASLYYNGAAPPGQELKPPGYLKELQPRKPKNPLRTPPATGGFKADLPAGLIRPKQPTTPSNDEPEVPAN